MIGSPSNLNSSGQNYHPFINSSVTNNDTALTQSVIVERVCVIPPIYYMDYCEKYYLHVTLNWDDGPFFLQFINWIQGKNPAG